MKAILTIEFDKLSDLQEAVNRLRGDSVRVVMNDASVNLNMYPKDVVLTGDAVEKHTADVAAGAKERKARSDAGQPRGPYKPRATETVKENAPPAAPATPAAGEQSTTPAAAGADAKAPTFDDVKDALQKVHDKAGLGMDSCVKLLQSFGTNRVTGIKPEQFAQFVASARALVGGK